MPAWLRERNRWGGWHRSRELETAPRPEETCLLKGKRDEAALGLAPPSSLGGHEVAGSALL